MSKKSWTTWFWSDQHFGHDNVIGFCNRPFKDKEEMKEALIREHNKLVSPGDLVIYVGDTFFYHSKEEMQEVLNRLNGRKILVRGNHDQKPRQMMNAGFEACIEEMVMTIGGERVHFSHYPFRMSSWKYKWRKFVNKIKKKLGMKRFKWPEKYHNRRPKNRGQFLIHGHTHSNIQCWGRQIHVGVDAWDYKPVNIQDISNLIARIKEAEKHGQELKIRSKSKTGEARK